MLALAPFLNDRDYLLLVFHELTRFHAVRGVFDAQHNPVRTLGPSADAAQELLAFGRSPSGLGGLEFSGSTRFLGDVYERLDEGVQKRFALLQTPEFVEEFILDRTLTLALAERRVHGLTIIDPTCGSGHFLLGPRRPHPVVQEGRQSPRLQAGRHPPRPAPLPCHLERPGLGRDPPGAAAGWAG